MALQKQNLEMNFVQGLDLKTDPFQVMPGKFLALKNMKFLKGGLLMKRDGFASMTSLPDLTSKYITTFNGNLVTIGTSLEAYSAPNQTWLNQGKLQPISLNTLSLIRSNTNQTQVDTAIASNGFVCAVFHDSADNSTTYRYAVLDSSTGQSIVVPTTIPGGGALSAPRVFVLGNYFLIVYVTSITGTFHFRYFSLQTAAPTITTGPTDISLNVNGNGRATFDGVVASNALYLAWNGNDGGGAIRFNYLDQNLVLHTEKAFTGKQAQAISVCADLTGGSPVIWAACSNELAGSAVAIAVDTALNTVLSPTTLWTGLTNPCNITAAAQNQILTVFIEQIFALFGAITPPQINDNWIKTVTLTQAGSLGSLTVLSKNIGIASKAFIQNSVIYFLTAYDDGSQFGVLTNPVQATQPTYFLVDSSFNVVAKLAYSNGGGYVSAGVLPSFNAYNSKWSVGYLFKDLIQAVNKSQGLASASGVYSQTGINLASFSFTPSSISSAEIGSNLVTSGGIVWMYDGKTPVEQNFHLWPNPLKVTPSITSGGLKAQIYFYQVTYEWMDNQGNIFRSAPSIPIEADASGFSPTPRTFTSTFSKGDTSITVSSVTGLFVGQVITDNTTAANIAAGTSIVSIDTGGLILGLSQPAAGTSGSPDTLQTVNTCSVTLLIPTLHLTYKTVNPIKIVIYRWSTAQQTYYQVTSVSSPLLNDKTVDYVTYTDTIGDAAALGNNILYTTGGVVEDIGPPATNLITLYKSRLFLVDAEDPNLLWYSKTVIEATPVEMSDLFTVYIAPTIGSAGLNTGPMTSISSMDDKLILFKRNAIYYMTGNGPDNTGANNDFSDPVFITATVGCANQSSIVYMPNGLMFQSGKGIWLLGRDLSVSYIGSPVEAYNSSTVLSALNIPNANEVRFTLDSGVVLKYDYFYQQWEVDDENQSISSTLYQSLHTYVTSLGTIFQESAGTYTDGVKPVLMSFTTSWIHLAGLQGYERAYFFYLLGTYLSPHKLQIQIAYDYNPTPEQSVIIQPTNGSAAYGGDSLFGGAEFFGGQSSLEQWRIFFNKQKCEAFQITVTEIFDSSMTSTPGAGLTLSGINVVVGAKSTYPRLRAAHSMG